MLLFAVPCLHTRVAFETVCVGLSCMGTAVLSADARWMCARRLTSELRESIINLATRFASASMSGVNDIQPIHTK